MRRITSCLALGVALLLPPALPAQEEAPAGDAALAALLGKAELEYTLNDRNEYQLLMNLDEDRTQLVYVRCGTYDVAGMAIREIYSPGLVGTTLAEAGLMLRLLRDNHDMIIGGWEYQTLSDGEVALFVVRVPADPAADVLRRLISVVAGTADKLEAEKSGKDDL